MNQKIEKSIALRQAEADVFADGPLEGCSRCVDKANEIYVLQEKLRAAEAQRDVLAHKLVEDNTSLDYGYEFPAGFTHRSAPETDEQAVRFWIEWADQQSEDGRLTPSGMSLCSFPGCTYIQPYVRMAHMYKNVANTADVVMHHYAGSHWHESSFAKMVDAMEPLRLALIAAGYGLPKEEEGS